MNDAIRTHSLAAPIALTDESSLVGTFLDRYRDLALRIATRIVTDPDVAEDVAQDALIRAFKSWDRYAKAEYQVAWVRKIVVRRAITALQARRDADPLPEYVTTQGDHGEDVAVRAVLAALSPKQQAILGLAIGEGLSYQEIADALEIPVGTVASRLNAAKAAFRKEWEGDR